MPIDPGSIDYTEFRVALTIQGENHFQVPVSHSVKEALRQMLQETLEKLGDENAWVPYDYAQEYKGAEHLTCAIDDPAMETLRELFSAQNLTLHASALKSPKQIDYYSARFTDSAMGECIGVRRASYFKGTVGKPFMFFLEGQLTMVEAELFRLDQDFDFLIFIDKVAIYRPSSMEHVAGLEGKLRNATPSNIQMLSEAVPILDFSFAEKLSEKYVRAQRLFAALKSRPDLGLIDPHRFEAACQANGIAVIQNNGKWAPEPEHEMALLELLDRRRYADPLVEHDAELFRAPSRSTVPKKKA